MVIAKGQIGNALTSVADNHVVAVADDIYDEDLEKYQSQINSEKLDNPAGGTTGQVLTKTDSGVAWQDKVVSYDDLEGKPTKLSDFQDDGTPVQKAISDENGNNISESLAGKVDKVTGKGLSTEDYTTQEKTKLSGISSGANKVEVSRYQTTGTHIADITIDDGSPIELYAPTAGSSQSVTVLDSLSSTSTTDALSANQGKVLKGLIDDLAPVASSGSYSDLDGKPENLSDFNNDLGFVESSDIFENDQIKSDLLPDYVLEYPSASNFPSTGESGKIYVDTGTNISYRWTGTEYQGMSSSITLGETSTTAYAGDKGKANADAIAALQGNVVNTVGGQKGAITLRGGQSANGSVNLEMNGNEIQGSVIGLGSSAYTNSTDYGTSLGANDNALTLKNSSGTALTTLTGSNITTVIGDSPVNKAMSLNSEVTVWGQIFKDSGDVVSGDMSGVGKIVFSAKSSPTPGGLTLEVVTIDGINYLHTTLPFYSDSQIASYGIGSSSGGGGGSGAGSLSELSDVVTTGAQDGYILVYDIDTHRWIATRPEYNFNDIINLPNILSSLTELSGSGLIRLGSGGNVEIDTSTYAKADGSNASGTWGINISGSATSLATSRTIWGQSFNGTSNVSGDMSGVGKITFSTGQYLEVVTVDGTDYLHTNLPFYSDSQIASYGIGGSESSGGGGSGVLSELSDVVVTNIQEGYILVYDSSSHKWIAKPENNGLASWVKTANKPDYSFSEISNVPGLLSALAVLTGNGFIRLVSGGTLEIDTNTYAKTDGSNASGTWGINISGSANRLTNPRSIWGQSFDGTSDISGNMSGVGKISFSAQSTPASSGQILEVVTIDGINYLHTNLPFYSDAQVASYGIGEEGSSGGSGVSVLSELSDVVITGIREGYILVYDNSSHKWIAKPENNDLASWAKAANKPDYSFSEISNVPSLLSALSELTGNGFIRLGSGGNVEIDTNTYAKSDGTNASGTWGISISGKAHLADQLATSRLIWGQSFNGTSDISGDLSGVGKISFNSMSSPTSSGQILEVVTIDGVNYLHTNLPFYSDSNIIAYGIGDESSGGGSGVLSELSDVVITGIQNGYVLVYDSSTHKWIAEPKYSGTVTSIGISVPSEFNVTGPITSEGTIAISLKSGYFIPTTSQKTEWDSAYTVTSSLASWAKAATKPDYNFSEIKNVPTLLTKLAALTGNGFIRLGSDGNLVIDTNTYAKSDGSNASGTWGINISGSATSLATSRSIWGQSFNGTGDISGDMSGVGKITFSTGQILEVVTVGGISYLHTNLPFYSDSNITAYGVGDDSSGGSGVSALSELSDVVITGIQNGYVLVYNSSTHQWISEPKFSGTVTSVGISVPSEFNVTGPITSEGTIAISLKSDYFIPSNSQKTEWNSAYTIASGLALWARASTKPSYNFSEIGGSVANSQLPTLISAISQLTGSGLIRLTNGTPSVDSSTYVKADGGTWNISISGNAETATVLHRKSNSLNDPVYQGITYSSGILRDTEGLFSSTNNANAVINIDRYSYENSTNHISQLGFSSQGMFLRTFSGSATDTTTPWNTIYHSSNLSKATLGLGNVDNTADINKNVASAQYAEYIKYRDTRNADPLPYSDEFKKGIEYALKANTADGLQQGNYYHGVMTLHPWGDKSGGDAWQLGFAENGRIYARHGAEAWSEWNNLALYSDIPTIYPLTIQKNGTTVGTYTPDVSSKTINITDVASASTLNTLKNWIESMFEKDTTSISGQTLIKAKYPLYSVGQISAGGVGSSSGGGGSNISVINSLSSSSTTDALSANMGRELSLLAGQAETTANRALDDVSVERRSSGYYECTSSSNSNIKTVSLGSNTDFRIGTSHKVKMTYATNVTCQYQFGLTTKPLYYNGAMAGSGNTWQSGEVLEVWFDGSKFYSKPWVCDSYTKSEIDGMIGNIESLLESLL